MRLYGRFQNKKEIISQIDMKQFIQTGIVGYGKSAKFFHVPLLKASEDFNVRSVLQRSKSDSTSDFPNARLVRDMKDMLKDDQLDLVIITSPNEVHYEQAFAALNAGKHVVVEKPFTVTGDEANKLIKVASERNLVLTVYQNRRWDGDFLTLKEIIASGRLGKIVEFESTYNRFRNSLKRDAWKEKKIPGSGILYDLSPHLIDQALLLFGHPDQVYADIRAQRGGAADDRFDLTLSYPGIKVLLRAGMLVPENTPRFILRGTKGSFVKYGLDPQESDLANGISPLNENWGKEPPENWGVLFTESGGEIKKEKVETKPGNYLLFYKKLRNAVLKQEKPPVQADTGMQIIRIIEKAIESNKAKQAVPF